MACILLITSACVLVAINVTESNLSSYPEDPEVGMVGDGRLASRQH